MKETMKRFREKSQTNNVRIRLEICVRVKFCTLYLILITLSMSEILKLGWESIPILNLLEILTSKINFLIARPVFFREENILPKSLKLIYKYIEMKLSYGDSSNIMVEFLLKISHSLLHDASNILPKTIRSSVFLSPPLEKSSYKNFTDYYEDGISFYNFWYFIGRILTNIM